MIRRRNGERGGSTLFEFTMVGIPIVFVLLSTFEIARGMWTYQTLGYSVKRGVRYSIVHGFDCTQNGNTCTVTIGQIASVIQQASLGLDTTKLNLTFTPNSGSAVTCSLSTGASGDCVSNTTVWPPAGANAPGMSVSISATYPFNSMISMFWPGTRGSGTMQFATVNFGASSNDLVQF
jgi:TadE-like protein